MKYSGAPASLITAMYWTGYLTSESLGSFICWSCLSHKSRVRIKGKCHVQSLDLLLMVVLIIIITFVVAVAIN